MRKRWIILGAAAVLLLAVCGAAQQASKTPSAQATSATLDRMVAAGKTPRELGQYVFDTHGCNSCHTVGQGGKLGFTEKGKNLTKGFEGCIRTLTAMNLIAQVPENQRSPDQRRTAARFNEFGCTLCHKIIPGKMGLTELGTKLTSLHLGCVDVEKLVASKPAARR
jgi:cytochrome c551/c552